MAYAENAVENGAKSSRHHGQGFVMEETGLWVRTNRGSLRAKVVINAAGVWADGGGFANDRFFTIRPQDHCHSGQEDPSPAEGVLAIPS